MSNVFIRGVGSLNAGKRTEVQLLSSSDLVSYIQLSQYPTHGIFLAVKKDALNNYFYSNYGSLKSSDYDSTNYGLGASDVANHSPIMQITDLASNLSSSEFAILGSYCLLYTSPSPRDRTRSRMPSSA